MGLLEHLSIAAGSRKPDLVRRSRFHRRTRLDWPGRPKLPFSNCLRTGGPGARAVLHWGRLAQKGASQKTGNTDDGENETTNQA
jgi:hypothetical protein